MKEHYVYGDKEYWYCDYCGQVIQEEAKFCWNCGDWLEEEK